ncbi:MAG: hypothetical protein JW768_06745 [Chitinispirillaceae bacterium]|nr:hypothetical protein [Chitinispirillaceae bacterium]
MYQRVALSVLVFIGLMLNRTVNADISGKVSDKAGKAIVGATVTLVSNGLTATTGPEGMYTLATTDVKSLPVPMPQNTGITIQNGFLNFILPEAAPVKYEIFDVKGNLLAKRVLKNASKGIYHFNIVDNVHTTTLCIIRASLGSEEITFNYLPMNSKNAVHSQNPFSTPGNEGLAKMSAVADTIKVTADGYKEQMIAITSYDKEVNVTMEAVTVGDCGEFTIISDDLSSAMATVDIIEWSYSGNVTEAVIEFGLTSEGNEFEAPVDLNEKNYRTLLLGMKQNKEYTYRIVVNGSCKSKDYTITTGRLSNAPNITKSGSGTSSMSGGFIVTTTGNGYGTGGGGGSPMTIIFDTDGDVVWAAEAPRGVSRARMSWDGKNMWSMNANNMGSATSGEMRRISMDGLDVQRNVSGLSGGDHDFTVTPDNSIVAIAFKNGGGSSVIKRAADGTISTIVADLGTLYNPSASGGMGTFHPNYIRYYEFDGGFFTLSDRNINAFVKFRPDGKLVWQFGGSNPKGKSFSLSQGWEANHGHELEEDGRVILFNNGAMMGGGTAKVIAYQLNESAMSASKSWEKNASGSSMSLGDVQRLPDDHILVTTSNVGKMDELDNSHNVVLSFSTGEFGYAMFRKSLYGPPIDY